MECWVIVMNWSTGCESDATSTEIMGVFTSLEKAKEYIPIASNKIKWDNYYEGELDIEDHELDPII